MAKHGVLCLFLTLGILVLWFENGVDAAALTATTKKLLTAVKVTTVKTTTKKATTKSFFAFGVIEEEPVKSVTKASTKATARTTVRFIDNDGLYGFDRRYMFFSHDYPKWFQRTRNQHYYNSDSYYWWNNPYIFYWNF